MATLATLVVKIASDTSKLYKGLDDAEKRANGFGGKLGSALSGAGKLAIAGTVAGIGLGVAALGGIMKSTIPLAGEFQQQLVGLGIAASSSGLSFDQLHDASLMVGGDTALVGVSATGAADAMTGLYKAGLTTTEIFGDLQGYMAGTAELGGALRGAIDLAAATELDMVQASDLAAVALATFGGELETEAERADFINTALNNMVQAADASVAEVGDLADALKNVGPTASALGVPIQDVNNALAILSTRGINGAEAGTALKSMLANLQRPTNAVVDTLDELGISLYNAEGTFVGLPNLVAQLEGSMGDLTDEQRNLAVQTLAGTFGMNAMNTLIGEGTEGWDAMAEATANAATIQEQAAAKANTFEGRMEALQGTIETLKIGISEQFLPIGEKLAGWFATIVETHGPAIVAVFETVMKVIDSFAGNMEEGMGPLNSFIEAIWDIAPQPVLDALVRLRDEIIPRLVGWFNRMVQPIINMVTSFTGWGEVLKTVGIALGAFAIISTVVGWISGLIAAVSAVGAAITGAGSIIGGIVALLGGPVTVVIGLVAGAIALLTLAWRNNWGGIQEKTQAVWDVVQPLLQTAWDWLQVNVPAALETLRGIWVDTVWPAIQTALQTVWTIIEGVFTSLSDWITVTLIPTIQSLYTKWVDEVWPEIQTVLENVWTVILGVFEELDRWINTNIIPWIEALQAVWADTVWPAIQTAVETVWAVLEPIWESLQEWMEEKLPVALEGMQGIFETVMTALNTAVEPVKKLWDDFVGAIQGFWDWISSHKFNFSINLPDLPDWALPGSPIPLHTAWKNFGSEMNRMTIRPRVNLAGMAGMTPAGVMATGGGGGGMMQAGPVYLSIHGDNPERIRRAVDEALGRAGYRADKGRRIN